MLEYNIYDDIATRTGGDIYVGVVGPVRTGKSTFIKKFLETFVLDKIQDKNKRARTIDEMPQSADGKTVMTTEPKFVPNEAVTVTFDKMSANVRLIDCVGYMVEGALGQAEGEKERLVKTPWQEKEIPFQEAAEIGTKKVICDHSTVGILVTTDGSFTDIGRTKYVESEERVVQELKKCGKPFVVLLNSQYPEKTDTIRLQESLQERYGVPVILCDITKLKKDDIHKIMTKILYEFPLSKIRVKLPKWICSLPKDHEIVFSCLQELKEKTQRIVKMCDAEKASEVYRESEYIGDVDCTISLADGSVLLNCKAKEGLYNKVLASFCGCDVGDECKLMQYVKTLSASYRAYEGIRQAMLQVQQDGYGVINPSLDDMELAEPEVVKKGNQYGLRLKASAPSYHIVRVDVESEISPTLGSEQQSEDFLKNMLADCQSDKKKIWDTNMFGMRLDALIKEDLSSKNGNMPTDTRNKLRKTMTRIVNEGKGGVICILL